MESLTLNELSAAVAGSAAAFRSITQLQPVGGEGDKVFPVTFEEGSYAVERRSLDGKLVNCVLMDSVQSQANRAEDALKIAIERKLIKLPLIEVSFQELNEKLNTTIPNLTSLDVPHRLADAILRHSVLPDNTPFSTSKYAQSWGKSHLWNATAIYDLCPTALLFGMWGSPEKTGEKIKIERAFVSEIVAVDVVSNNSEKDEFTVSFLVKDDGTIDVLRNTAKKAEPEENGARRDIVNKRPGYRIDPLNVSSSVMVSQNKNGSLTVGAGKKPSEIGHGNIPFKTSNSGIRFRYAEQTTVVSLGALRKLHFPLNGKDEPCINDAGRTVLAAMGLCAGVLAAESNTSLRSRCHLWPMEEREWELLEKPGQQPRRFRMSGEQVIALLNEAVAAAQQTGLKWMEEKLVLQPSNELVKLIQQSMEAAKTKKGKEKTTKDAGSDADSSNDSEEGAE